MSIQPILPTTLQQTAPTAQDQAPAHSNELIEAKIRQFLSGHFLVDFQSEANENTDLFEQGFIDSFGYVELISFLEKEFQIRFTDEELISRAFSSLSAMIVMVGRKLNAN